MVSDLSRLVIVIIISFLVFIFAVWLAVIRHSLAFGVIGTVVIIAAAVPLSSGISLLRTLAVVPIFLAICRAAVLGCAAVPLLRFSFLLLRLRLLWFALLLLRLRLCFRLWLAFLFGLLRLLGLCLLFWPKGDTGSEYY